MVISFSPSPPLLLSPHFHEYLIVTLITWFLFFLSWTQQQPTRKRYNRRRRSSKVIRRRPWSFHGALNSVAATATEWTDQWDYYQPPSLIEYKSKWNVYLICISNYPFSILSYLPIVLRLARCTFRKKKGKSLRVRSVIILMMLQDDSSCVRDSSDISTVMMRKEKMTIKWGTGREERHFTRKYTWNESKMRKKPDCFRWLHINLRIKFHTFQSASCSLPSFLNSSMSNLVP